MTNTSNPGLWSRFDWTESGGALYYCHTVSDAAIAGDAQNATPADSADLVTGCNGGVWDTLTPQWL